MEGVLKLITETVAGKKAAVQPDDKIKLINEIREVQARIDNAYTRFEYENDSDLIDACVYELESLSARYRYLLRCAKEQEIVCPAADVRVNKKGEQKAMG